MKRLLLSLFSASLVFACSQPTQTINLEQNDTSYIAQVSNTKGADFSVKLNFNSGFKVKVSSNGTVAKQPTDISKVDVYLLNLPTGFTGTDPFGIANANIVTSFTDVAKTGSSLSITFKNVPGLANPNQYWVGVIAKDSSNMVLNKAPSTAWTGGTTSTPALSLSSGGIGVDTTTLAVSSTSDISVNVPLLDAVGATVGASATVTGGSSTLPNTSITIQ